MFLAIIIIIITTIATTTKLSKFKNKEHRSTNNDFASIVYVYILRDPHCKYQCIGCAIEERIFFWCVLLLFSNLIQTVRFLLAMHVSTTIIPKTRPNERQNRMDMSLDLNTYQCLCVRLSTMQRTIDQKKMPFRWNTFFMCVKNRSLARSLHSARCNYCCSNFPETKLICEHAVCMNERIPTISGG